MELSIKELAETTGKTQVAIYNLAKKLGRKPTIEEIMSVKRGRKCKY